MQWSQRKIEIYVELVWVHGNRDGKVVISKKNGESFWKEFICFSYDWFLGVLEKLESIDQYLSEWMNNKFEKACWARSQCEFKKYKSSINFTKYNPPRQYL